MSRRHYPGAGVAAGMMAVGAEKVVSLGVAMYLSRYLSLGEFGHYAFVLAFLNVFQVVPDGAVESVLVTRLARDPTPAALAGKGALMRLWLSLTLGSLGLVVLMLAARGEGVVAPAAVWGAGLAATAANPYRALLRGRLEMSRYLILLAGQGLSGLLLLALVVRVGGGLSAVLAAVVGGNVSGLLIGRILAGRGARLRSDRALPGTLAGAAWPLALSALTLLGAQQVLQLLLLRGHGASEVGLLGGAQKLVEAAGLLPQALMVSLLPVLASRMPDVRAARQTAATAGRLQRHFE